MSGLRDKKILIVGLFFLLFVCLIGESGYFISGRSVYHITSVASSTIYYLKLQWEHFREGVFYPQYWSNRLYTSGPVHTGLGFYNPLLLLLAPIGKFSHALVSYGILLKFIAGSGMLLYLRRLGFGWPASLTSAALFSLNPYFSSFGSDPQFIGVVCFIPWILLVLGNLKSLHSSLVLAVILALAYLVSNIQSFVFLCALLLLPYWLLDKNRPRAGYVLAAGFLATGLLLFELMPTITVFKYGNRSLAPDNYLRMFLYILLLISAAGIFRRGLDSANRIARNGVLFLAAVSIFFSEGQGTLANLLSGNYARSMQESHFVFNEYVIRYFTFPQALIFLATLRNPALACAPYRPLAILSLGYMLLNFFLRFEPLGLSRYLYAVIPDDYIRYSFIPLAGFSCMTALGLETAAGFFRRSGRTGVLLLAFFLVADNCAVYLNRTLFTNGLSYLETPASEYAFLKNIPPLDRVEAVYDNEHFDWKVSFYPRAMPKWLLPAYFGANSFSRVGIGVIPKWNSEFNRKALPLYFGIDRNDPVNPWLNLAGVRYIFSYRRLPDNPALSLVKKADEYYIYRNESVMPRVFLLPSDPGPESGWPGMVGLASGTPGLFSSGLGWVRVSRYENEEVVFDCRINGDCLLVFTDTYFPGWQAFSGEKPVSIEQVGGIFRGMRLSAGLYTLSMRYHPAVYRWSAVLSFFLWAGCALSVLAAFMRRKDARI